jgi:hypothetical protein
LKTKAAQLSTLRAAPTTSALRESVDELQDKQDEMEKRLAVLRSGSVKPISKAEREKTERDFKRWERVRKDRKAWCEEVVGMLMEGGMGKEEIWVSFFLFSILICGPRSCFQMGMGIFWMFWMVWIGTWISYNDRR